MKKASRHPLLIGTAVIIAAGGLYACTDFLTDAAAPQGTLDETTLANKAGVEGSLIAAYRTLDWNTGVGGQCSCTRSSTSIPRLARDRSVQARKFARW